MLPPRNSTPLSHRAQQKRSVQTAYRIVEVAIALARKGELADTPMSRIAEAAGVSIGGLYGRFASRPELELAVFERHTTLVTETFEAELAPSALEGIPARDVVRRFAQLLVGLFTGPERELARQASIFLRYSTSEPPADIFTRLNQRCHAMLHDALLARRDELRHEDPDAAVIFVDLAMSAAAREQLLYSAPGLPSAGDAPAPDEVVDRLTDLGCGYLGIT